MCQGSNTDPIKPFIRDGVGIERVTGAAARAGAVKFDLEILPAGTLFELRLELHSEDADDEQLLAAGLMEWQRGRSWLGGRVARGLGAFTLESVQHISHNLNDSTQIMNFLRADDLTVGSSSADSWSEKRVNEIRAKRNDTHRSQMAVTRGWVALEGVLQADGPLLTNDAIHAGMSGFDHAPLLVQLGDWQHPLLTGAGLRGVIRSHAERIARTIATYQAQHREHFLQICPACDPNARRPHRAAEMALLPALESCDSLLLHSAMKSTNERIDPDYLCLACRLFGSSWLGSRLLVEDAPYAGKERPIYKILDFLAVDRFTGGGSEGLKFDALALWQPTFTMRLHLHNPEQWELGWLALVLRDLSEGWLAVGYGTAKGLGRVRLQNWTLRTGYLTEQDRASLLPNSILSDSGLLATLPAAKAEGVYDVITVHASTPAAYWPTVAQGWVDAFRRKLTSADPQQHFKRPDKMHLSNDDYFRPVATTSIEQLCTLEH
ncbi:MAG: RAMP superfamily CRISPR-associated protein [Caldilineaceae bacterium]